MSAFVAFDGFPGQDVQDPIGTLLVQERQTPVTVPAHPARTAAPAGRTHSAHAVAGRHATTRRARGPLAHATPVNNRTSTPAPSTAQPPASAQQPQQQTSPTQQTDPVTQTAPAGGGNPSLPSTTLPAPLPAVTVPLPPPQSNSQLPIDTSGVTSILGNP